MANVIEFLERMGADAGLRHLTGLDLEHAMLRAGIDPAIRTAILTENQHLLESLVGAPHPVCCLVHAPEEEEGEGEDDHDGEDPGEDPEGESGADEEQSDDE